MYLRVFPKRDDQILNRTRSFVVCCCCFFFVLFFQSERTRQRSELYEARVTSMMGVR